MKIATTSKIFFLVFFGLMIMSYGQSDRGYYTVQPGESLWQIGQKLKVDYREIQRINGFTGTSIQVGQRLRIPAATLSQDNESTDQGSYSWGVSVDEASQTVSGQENKLHQVQQASAINIHEVKSGETLFQISQHYGLTVQEVKSMNGLTNNQITPGQALMIRNGKQTVNMLISQLEEITQEGVHAMPQVGGALSQRDSMRIRSLSQLQLDEFITLLNNISDTHTYGEDFDDFVSVAVAGDRKIFYNSQATIRPDLDPEILPGQEHTVSDPQEITDYLDDFRSFYPRTSQRTISISQPLVSEIRFSEELGSYYMKIKYTSVFEGKHTTLGKTFPRRTRVAHFRIEQIRGEWKSYITSLCFFNPNEVDSYREANAFETGLDRLKKEGDKMLSMFEYVAAMNQYQKARIQAPNDYYVNNQIAKLEVILGEIEARKFYLLESYNSRINRAERNRAEESNLPDLYFERATLLERDKQYTEALNDYQRVVALAPAYRKAHIKLASIALSQHQVPEAIASYSQAVDLHLFPNEVGLLEILAQLELEAGMTQKAKKHLKQALEYQGTSTLASY